MTNGIRQLWYYGVPMYDNTPDNTLRDMNFGARLGTEIGGWQLSGYYLYQYQHAPAINLSHFAKFGLNLLSGGYYSWPDQYAAATLDHPRTHMFGFSFNKFIKYGGFVLRGEGSYTKDGTQFDLNNVLGEFAATGTPGTGYSKHDVWEGVIGIDKQWSNIHLWTDSALITNFQAFYRHINNWDEDYHQVIFQGTPLATDYGTRATQNRLRFSFLAMTDYVHGTVKPLVFVAYEPTGQWMTNASVEWCPDGHWEI